MKPMIQGDSSSSTTPYLRRAERRRTRRRSASGRWGISSLKPASRSLAERELVRDLLVDLGQAGLQVRHLARDPLLVEGRQEAGIAAARRGDRRRVARLGVVPDRDEGL